MAVREPIGSRMTHHSWTARVAVATIFFVNGLLVANWFARIPDVKQRLG